MEAACCPKRCPVLSNCTVFLFFLVTTVTASEITKIVQWRRLRNVALAPSCVPYVRPGVGGRGGGKYGVISGTSYSEYVPSCIQCLTCLGLFVWTLPALMLPLHMQCSRCQVWFIRQANRNLLCWSSVGVGFKLQTTGHVLRIVLPGEQSVQVSVYLTKEKVATGRRNLTFKETGIMEIFQKESLNPCVTSL